MSSLTQKNLEHAARRFHALADETRLEIIERLSEGEQCVCDLTGLLGTAQSLLSFHLKTLKDAGILSDRREGRWVYYSLNPEAITELERLLGSLKPGNPFCVSRPSAVTDFFCLHSSRIFDSPSVRDTCMTTRWMSPSPIQLRH